jgi:glycosyltransferase involved in cell wall biosynthesis
MKVLQIIDSLNAGGAEVLAVNIANGMTASTVESHLCVTRKEGPLKNAISRDVRYLFLNKKRTLDVQAIYRLLKYIKQHQINIIHAHSTSYFIACCIKLLRPRVKLVWHDHFGNSEFLTPKSRKPIRKMSFLFDAVIAVNTKLLNWNQKNLSVHHYFQINNFAKFSSSNQETTLFGEEGKRIVHVAGFTEQKDHLTLLKAFKQVILTYPDWTLHLIGKKYPGEYMSSVETFITQHQLDENVFLYGLKTDIQYILSQASMGVLSSKSEGLPVSLLEYGLANLPVVLTDVGECKELIEIEECVVPPENPQKLAIAMIQMIEDPTMRKKAAQQLNQRVHQEYTIDSFLEKLNEIYAII